MIATAPNQTVATDALPTLLTVTWAGDRQHFAMLRESLSNSRLADCHHRVVVQHEDMALFEPFRSAHVELISTASLLPATVEQNRVRARHWHQRLGRRAVIRAGSLCRLTGFPAWVRYTGWQVQQLSKYFAVLASTSAQVCVIDSDVLVTPWAQPDDFAAHNHEVVALRELSDHAPRGKTAHWLQSSRSLLQLPGPAHAPFDRYFDTPFVMSAQVLQQLCQWLETHYQQPWWQVMLAQAPRRWSEFGLYCTWLKSHNTLPVRWMDSAEKIGYLFDASDAETLKQAFYQQMVVQKKHYITIHSQSSGRQRWTSEHYRQTVMACLQEFNRQATP